jgi:uncharacterized ferredoxin-like protein
VCAAKTAPKACGIDLIETLIVDGEDKLVVAICEIDGSTEIEYFIRVTGNVDAIAS